MSNIQVAGETTTHKAVTRPSLGFPGVAGRECGPSKESMVRWFSWWFFAECFIYQYASPIFSINVGINLTPDRILFVLIILIFFARRKPASSSVRMLTIEYLMVAFTILSTLSWVLYGADTKEGRFRWLATLFTLCYQPFTAFYIARRIPFDRPAVKKLFWGLTAIGVYVGLTGIFERFEWLNFLVFPKYILDPSIGSQFGRSRGPFAAAIVSGGALIITFLASASIWPTLKGARRSWMFLALLTMCITIYLTNTRGVWVGFGSALGIVLITRTGMRKIAKVIVVMALLGFLSGGASKFSLYDDSLFSKRSETVDYRWANYMVELNMFMDNPIFGVGYGNFEHVWKQYFGGAESELTRDLNDGNNTTLPAILAEMGIVGITVYVAILGCALKICFSAYRHLEHEDQEFERKQVIVTSGTLMAFLMMGITTDFRFHELFCSVLFLLLGTISNPGFAAMNSGSSVPTDKATFRGASSFRTA